MIKAKLAVRLPFDWRTMLGYLAPRAIPGVETVDADTYRRTIRINGVIGYLGVTGPASRGALTVHLSESLAPHRDAVLSRLGALFDVDAEVRQISRALSADSLLAPLVERRPGLRVAGAVDRFELALRAVLGQQVSVRGASTLAGRLASLYGEPIADAPPGLTHVSVTADRLSAARPSAVARIGTTNARAATVVALARAALAGVLAGSPDVETQIARLQEVPGIGPWTASYIALRAFHWPDAFPHGDLGLRKAAGNLTARALLARAEQWRPWRAYAAMHLWASLHA